MIEQWEERCDLVHETYLWIQCIGLVVGYACPDGIQDNGVEVGVGKDIHAELAQYPDWEDHRLGQGEDVKGGCDSQGVGAALLEDG